MSQVVIPAMISIRTVEPRSEILKNRSRPPGGADPTRTTLSVSVSDTPPPFRTGGRTVPLHGEGDRSIGRTYARRKERDARGPFRRDLAYPGVPPVPGRPTVMANTTSNQRPTKAERKEQARRERAELQRKMARSRRTRRVVGVVLLLVAVGLAVAWFLRPQAVLATPGELFAAAPEAREAAGCDPVEDVGPYQPESRDREHVDAAATPPLSTYPSVPPASGPHNEITWGAGVYDSPPPIERVRSTRSSTARRSSGTRRTPRVRSWTGSGSSTRTAPRARG